MTSFIRSFFNGNKKEESIYQIKEEHYEDLGLIEENILKNDNDNDNEKIKSCTKQISKGGFNIVYNCIDQDQGNILRKTVDPIFEKINGSYEIANETKRDIINMWQENLSQNLELWVKKLREPNEEDEKDMINKFLEEQKLTISNINKASELKISPEVKFNGYIEEKKDGRILLYHAVKMEKYDINFLEYINKNNKIQQINNQAKGLVDLFQKMHNKMNIVCYDLKLENIVLKLEDSEIKDIRLIDWDGNYCNNFHIDENIDKKLLLFMSVLIIANYFIHHTEIKTNIFYDYYLKNEKEINKNEDKLLELFCNKKYLYSYMVKFYFLKQEYNSFSEKYDNIIKLFKNPINTFKNIILFKILLITLKSKNKDEFKLDRMKYYNKGIKTDEVLKLDTSNQIISEHKRKTKKRTYTLNNTINTTENIKYTIKEFYKIQFKKYKSLDIFELSYLPDVESRKLNNDEKKYNDFITTLPRYYAFVGSDEEILKLKQELQPYYKNIKPTTRNFLIVQYKVVLEQFFNEKIIKENEDEFKKEREKNNEIFEKQIEERMRKKKIEEANEKNYQINMAIIDAYGGRKTKRSKKKNRRKTRRK